MHIVTPPKAFPAAPKVYERVSVNLTKRSSEALLLASVLTGLNRTDVINRALQAYAYLEDMMSGGGKVLVQPAGEDVQQLKFM